MYLHCLAAELLYMIVEEIEDEDERHTTCMQLSLTYRRLREVLTPEVFKTVRFSNDKRISDSAIAFATKYGGYIERLKFVGFDPADEAALPEIRANRNPPLPPSAITLFKASRDLLLPNIKKFVISFNHNFDDQPGGGYDERDGVGFFVPIQDTSELTVTEEARSPRRGLWANTYQALASNTTISHLVIDKWPPRAILVFGTEAWKNSLGKLHSFEISVAGYVGLTSVGCGKLRGSNICPGYQLEIEKMGEYFFHHLDSAKTVKISGSKRFHLGPNRDGNVLVPNHFFLLPANSMPVVENLELSRTFIDPELLMTIINHRHTLRKLVLASTLSWAFGSVYSKDCAIFSWSEFFDDLSEVEDLALDQFEMTTHCCPLSFGEWEARVARESDPLLADTARDDPQFAMNDLRKEKIKLLGYGNMKLACGSLRYHYRMNGTRHHEGRDLAAYERFMSKVRATREKHKEAGMYSAY